MLIFSKGGLLWRSFGTRHGAVIIDCPEADRIATVNGHLCAERVVKVLDGVHLVEVDDVTFKIKRLINGSPG